MLQSSRKIQIVAGSFVIYGAGGHAAVVIEAARSAGLAPTLVIDDHPSANTLFGLHVEESDSIDWTIASAFKFVVAVGNNADRARIFRKLLDCGGKAQNVIHPFTCISPTAQLGNGTVVFAGTIVNARAVVEENCILNTGSRIDHDCHIGAHAHICPGGTLAGNVRVGARTLIGTGACCKPGVSIGNDVVIGAGAVVIRSVDDGTVAVGNPAKARAR